MSELDDIYAQMAALKEIGVKPSNIHMDYNTLHTLFDEIPLNGITNIELLGCQVTISLKEHESSVH